MSFHKRRCFNVYNWTKHPTMKAKVKMIKINDGIAVTLCISESELKNSSISIKELLRFKYAQGLLCLQDLLEDHYYRITPRGKRK